MVTDMKQTPNRQLTMVGIRELRIASGMSIEQLVNRIYEVAAVEVHGDTLRNIELGHKRGSSRLMNAWAKALRISPLDVYLVDEAAMRTEERVA